MGHRNPLSAPMHQTLSYSLSTSNRIDSDHCGYVRGALHALSHCVVHNESILYGFSTTNQRRDECLLTHCAQTEQSSGGARRRAEGRDGGQPARRGAEGCGCIAEGRRRGLRRRRGLTRAAGAMPGRRRVEAAPRRGGRGNLIFTRKPCAQIQWKKSTHRGNS